MYLWSYKPLLWASPLEKRSTLNLPCTRNPEPTAAGKNYFVHDTTTRSSNSRRVDLFIRLPSDRYKHAMAYLLILDYKSYAPHCHVYI